MEQAVEQLQRDVLRRLVHLHEEEKGRPDLGSDAHRDNVAVPGAVVGVGVQRDEAVAREASLVSCCRIKFVPEK